MEKKQTFKLLIILFLTGLSLLFLIPSVYASSMEDHMFNSLNAEDEMEEVKIMRYDALTGETTEIDRYEVKKLDTELKEEKEKVNTFTSNVVKPISTYSTLSTSSSTASANKICKAIWTGGSGTATLVNSRMALTAAHCVWETDTKVKHNNFVLYPGYNNRLTKIY